MKNRNKNIKLNPNKNLNKNKKKIQTKNQLSSYYGIGLTQSRFVCNILGISSHLQMNNLTLYEKKKMTEYLKKRIKIINKSWFQGGKINNINLLSIGDNLKYIKKNAILAQIHKSSYRGFRLKKGYPVRGQRTRSNHKTRKRLINKWV